LDAKKADNEILAVVKYLREKESPRSIVLVSKDINVRIKASALGFDAEDYFNDHVIQDSDLLYSGSQQLPADFWNRLKKSETWEDKNPDGHKVTLYRVKGAAVKSMLVNQFVYLNDFHAIVKQITADEAVLETLVRYDTAGKKAVFGISPNNREQNFALNLLLNPECDFVTMLGQAGTGKTLLALAAGLTQVFDKRLYDEIIVTRATVPIGDEIGFLPGSEEEKMAPWMGAIDDNLEVLSPSDDEGKAGDSGRKITDSFIRSRVKIKSMAFMRGRTFINKYVIVDEAQNLTPKQAKALITRAGPGTKMVFMGNIAQIDTPYLTEGSSGLTHVVDRMKGWCHSGHITLIRGERSRLADRASEVL
jgi:PhoH-like ATPase